MNVDRIQGSLINLLTLPPSIGARFDNYHAKHPDVYKDLVGLCREWRRRAGTRRWSIDAAFNVLRWQRVKPELNEDEEEIFKLNDHYRSRYARLIMAQEPDLAGIFEVRSLKAP